MTISSLTTGSVAAAPGEGTRAVAHASPPSSSAEAVRVAASGIGGSSQPPSAERVAQAVKQVNEAFTQRGQNLYASFELDKATGINLIKVQDKVTREVISQYPSKEIVAMAEALAQSQEAKGQLLNVRV